MCFAGNEKVQYLKGYRLESFPKTETLQPGSRSCRRQSRLVRQGAQGIRELLSEMKVMSKLFTRKI